MRGGAVHRFDLLATPSFYGKLLFDTIIMNTIAKKRYRFVVSLESALCEVR